MSAVAIWARLPRSTGYNRAEGRRLVQEVGPSGDSQAVEPYHSLPSLMAACAAAKRATGTRYGEHET